MSENQPLFDAIERGEYDNDLHALKEAVEGRQNARRYGHTVNEYEVGDRVMIDSNVRPKLLVGKVGTITRIEGYGKVAVKLDNPVRRWQQPICPVSMLTPAC